MNEFSGLSSHLKIKVRRENSYQLVRTMNIVFLSKGLLYQLSDTSLRDYFFCFFFSTYHLSWHHVFSKGELHNWHAGLFRLLLPFSSLILCCFQRASFSTFASVTAPEGSVLHPLLLSCYSLLQKAEIQVSSLHWEITTLPPPPITRASSDLSIQDRGR